MSYPPESIRRSKFIKSGCPYCGGREFIGPNKPFQSVIECTVCGAAFTDGILYVEHIHGPKEETLVTLLKQMELANKKGFWYRIRGMVRLFLMFRREDKKWMEIAKTM